MSTREAILTAIASTLAGIAGGRVYRSRKEQLGVLPAVVVEPISETSEEKVLGYADKRLGVGIIVYANGDTPDNAADATLTAIWTALYASSDLGLGSDVHLDSGHEIEWDFEHTDYVRATLTAMISYRTSAGGM